MQVKFVFGRFVYGRQGSPAKHFFVTVTASVINCFIFKVCQTVLPPFSMTKGNYWFRLKQAACCTDPEKGVATPPNFCIFLCEMYVFGILLNSCSQVLLQLLSDTVASHKKSDCDSCFTGFPFPEYQNFNSQNYSVQTQHARFFTPR